MHWFLGPKESFDAAMERWYQEWPLAIRSRRQERAFRLEIEKRISLARDEYLKKLDEISSNEFSMKAFKAGGAFGLLRDTQESLEKARVEADAALKQVVDLELAIERRRARSRWLWTTLIAVAAALGSLGKWIHDLHWP